MCSPIGHNNTKHFLCPIRSRHLLEFLEIVRWESVSRISSALTWKLSCRLFSRPDWLPLGLRGWCMVETIEIILILYTARTHHSSKRMVPQKTWVLENFGTISKSEKQLWSISKSHFQVILCLEVLNFFKSRSWILKLGSHSLVKSQIYILRTFLHTVFPEKNAQACI